MDLSNKTGRQMYDDIKAGLVPQTIWVRDQGRADQCRHAEGLYLCRRILYGLPDKSAADRIHNELAKLFRAKNCPVIWTYLAYTESGEDCGIWTLRAHTPEALQAMTIGSRRSELDDRLDVDRTRDIIINKRMASAFFETNLSSLLTFHKVDTVVVTGGSTSGCVRATVVDSVSRGLRTTVPEECVADRHESPHFASLYDMALKYADIVPVAEVLELIRARLPSAPH